MKHRQLIDQLGRVKARLAELQDEERSLVQRIKHQLLVAGQQSAEAELFRATLVTSERVAVDTGTVRKLYPIEHNPELYTSALVESLRVVARVGELAAA